MPLLQTKIQYHYNYLLKVKYQYHDVHKSTKVILSYNLQIPAFTIITITLATQMLGLHS